MSEKSYQILEYHFENLQEFKKFLIEYHVDFDANCTIADIDNYLENELMDRDSYFVGLEDWDDIKETGHAENFFKIKIDKDQSKIHQVISYSITAVDHIDSDGYVITEKFIFNKDNIQMEMT